MSVTFRKSIDEKDIKFVIEVVESFGGNADELTKIKTYFESELRELGDNRLLFILSENQSTIGVVQLLIKSADDDPDLADGSSTAHIHGLQIKKSAQRKGHAFKMMEELESYSKKSGIKRLTLGVDADNPPALGLYKKLGYEVLKEEEGREPEVPLYYLYKDLI